jgi:hypothetical protein
MPPAHDINTWLNGAGPGLNKDFAGLSLHSPFHGAPPKTVELKRIAARAAEAEQTMWERLNTTHPSCNGGLDQVSVEYILICEIRAISKR